MRRLKNLRPSGDQTFEAVEASLAAGWTDLEPDPLFVRRLRTQALNRYVVAREGDTATIGHRRAGGEVGRLGRACLFATLLLGVSAASALAASQSALPGETLYSLKLRVEQLRLDVLPAHLHDDLNAYALMERTEELGRLTVAGQFDLAIAMMPSIEEAYDRVAEGERAHGAARESRIQLKTVLEGLLALGAHDSRAQVQRVLDRAQDGSAAGSRGGSQADQPEHASPNDNTGGSAGPGSAGPDDATGAEPPSQAHAPTRPEETPRPQATGTPKPVPSQSEAGADPKGASE